MSDPPRSIVPSLGLFCEYLNKLPNAPFLALGEFGHGRGHWIEATLRARGFEPVWMYDNEEVPAFDLDDRRLFPVYDLVKPVVPVTCPCVLLVPSDFRRIEGFKPLDFAMFPSPPEWEREEFLRSEGYPETLADGNPTYYDLLAAMVGWDAAKVVVRAGPSSDLTWDGFRAGGEPPVPEGLVGYYAAYSFPVEEWFWNRNLGLLPDGSYPTAALKRIMLDQLRIEWPEKTTPFPEILKEPKNPRNRSASIGSTKDVPQGPKSYAVDWS